MKHNATLKLWMFATALFAIAIAFPALLPAQAVSGDLVGIVTDATGAAIANATIIATNDATGVKTTAVTDSSGAYRLRISLWVLIA